VRESYGSQPRPPTCAHGFAIVARPQPMRTRSLAGTRQEVPFGCHCWIRKALRNLHVVLLTRLAAAWGATPLGTFLPRFFMEKPISPSQVPRIPTASELRDLQALIAFEGHEPESVFCAYIAVFQDYMTGSPGYCGNVLSVVWDGSPIFLTFSFGTMERSSVVAGNTIPRRVTDVAKVVAHSV
jgi:hypothetical protein